jgi:hypothetical protein
MKSSVSYLIIVFSAFVVLFSCQKEIYVVPNNKARTTSELVENAKSWYLKNLDYTALANPLRPHWDDARTVQQQDESTLLVIPTSEHVVMNPDFTIRRFFIFPFDDADVADGRIVELLGNQYNVNMHLDLLLSSMESSEIKGFNGSIIQYNINYKYIDGIVFKEGKLMTNMKTRIMVSTVRELDSLMKVGHLSELDSIPVTIND